MEASSGFPESLPAVPDIRIFQVFDDNELSHRLIIDGRDTGRIDWEESPDSKIGYIDGFDAEDEVVSLPNQELVWIVIAGCMFEYHPEVRRVEHICGAVEFLED